ncbi:MAG: hypothetical protein DCC55_05750 [Chloroflexi bacterium]|nr:MAG: hypothetical protein DCC55_05750 [Chloroflexota bacterium]
MAHVDWLVIITAIMSAVVADYFIRRWRAQRFSHGCQGGNLKIMDESASGSGQSWVPDGAGGENSPGPSQQLARGSQQGELLSFTGGASGRRASDLALFRLVAFGPLAAVWFRPACLRHFVRGGKFSLSLGRVRVPLGSLS